MKWEKNRPSDQVEDRRSQPGRGGMFGGGGGRRGGGRNIGLGTIVVALVAGWIFGINPITILGALSGGGELLPPAQTQTQSAPAEAPSDERLVDLSAAHRAFERAGKHWGARVSTLADGLVLSFTQTSAV
ncbi:MAG: neutral zinc metallopeptidase, partial [Hydrogenophaga sp.]